MKKINRKTIKNAAKKCLKVHYLLFVAILLFAAILGTKYAGALSFLNTSSNATQTDSVLNAASAATSIPSFNLASGISTIITDGMDSFKAQTEQALEEDQSSGITIAGIGIERRKGTIASVLNMVSSGSIYVSIYSAILGIIGSTGAAEIIFILLSLSFFALFWAFVTNLYRVVYARIYLEARKYRKVPMSTFAFLFRVKRYLRSVRTMFVVFIFELLWSLTIVGGFIKHYSYLMVPALIAENPDLGTLEAITMSRRLMNGRKWEAFVLDLSFIPWQLLPLAVGLIFGSLSMLIWPDVTVLQAFIPNLLVGLFGIFFLNPYMEGTHFEFYAAIRETYVASEKEGFENFNDKYLYEWASEETISAEYADLIEAAKQPDPEYHSPNKVKKFFAKWFGIVPTYNSQEDKNYRAHIIRKHNIEKCMAVQNHYIYPTRLCPLKTAEKQEDLENMGYTRCYSILAIIVVFLALSIFGWLWEVSLHLVTEHKFVNRGTFHGPWLPIYGSGCVMILLLLRRFREKPWLEFLTAVTLCGIVEYFTSVFLELTHGGTKWWDYHGYFLNINGRVCAEGLLVFGLGGCAVVYLVAPLLDNLVRKIKMKILIPILAAIMIVFAADAVYSHYYPNKGDGITNYETETTPKTGQGDHTYHMQL